MTMLGTRRVPEWSNFLLSVGWLSTPESAVHIVVEPPPSRLTASVYGYKIEVASSVLSDNCPWVAHVAESLVVSELLHPASLERYLLDIY